MNKIKYIENRVEKEISLERFVKENKVDSVIRIQEKDFEQIDRKKEFLTHFNLRKAGHKVGEKYAIIKIVKPGGIDEKGNEFFPIFDLSDFIVGLCVSFEFKSFEEVKESDFEFSMKNIQNKNELEKEILFRYKKFRKGKSDEEVLEEGISLTKLEIIN